MATKYKLVIINFPKKEGRVIGKVYRRFRTKILMRNKKYPGFLTKKAPYLTMEELRSGPMEFVVDGVRFSSYLIVPEFILEELNTELEKIGILFIADRTADINVFSPLFDLDLKMKAMKRFWMYYEPKNRMNFRKFVLKLVNKIHKMKNFNNISLGLRTKFRKEVLWVLEVVNFIEEIDWTRSKDWDDEPQFTRNIIDPLIVPLRKFIKSLI